MRPDLDCRLADASHGTRWLLGLVGALALVACERLGAADAPTPPAVKSVAPAASAPQRSIYSVVPDWPRL